MHFSRWLGLGWLALASSCGGGGGGGGEIALEAFCDELGIASAATAARCGCADGEARCPIAEGSLQRRAIEEGALRYDPAAAAAFVSAVRDAQCDARDLRRDGYSLDLLTLFGTVNGTVDPGGACIDAPGTAGCRSGGCEAERCVGLPRQGETCDELRRCDEPLDGDPERRLRCLAGSCVPVAEPGESCAALSDCRIGQCVESVCVEGRPDGDACDEDQECASRRCDFSTGRCRPPERDDSLCTAPGDCASGWCGERLDLGAGRCMAQLADGSSCSEQEACQSGLCLSGTCQPAVCGLIP